MKKGFTLVELLGVIAILAILIIIATPAILTIAKKNKDNMYCKKVKTVIKAAQLYGEEYFQNIDKTVISNEDYLIDDNRLCVVGSNTIDHCQITTIGSLAERGFLKLEKVGKSAYEKEFLDPRDFKTMLNEEVMVYIVNKRMNAQFLFKSKKDGEKCTDSVEVGGGRYKSYYYKEGSTIMSSE